MIAGSDPIAHVVKNLVKTRIPTGYGEFTLYLYAEHGKEHLALVIGDVAGKSGVPVRVHSECLTGDVFGSRRCDCGDQLRHAMQYLGRVETGLLIYLRQEGRGIGLQKKMEAYNLQDQGMDTVEANIQLGHQPDERDYGIAARILRDLDVRSICLITNNPHKVEELQAHGIEIESRIPIEVGHHADNLGYLRSKAEKMEHLLSFRERIPEHHELAFIEPLLDQLGVARGAPAELPFVTLSRVQTLNGKVLPVGSGFRGAHQVATLGRSLLSHHDGWLVEATAFADGCLSSALEGASHGDRPRLILFSPDLDDLSLDSLPSWGNQPPILLTTRMPASTRQAALRAMGMQIVSVPSCANGDADMSSALSGLARLGVATLLVEGGGGLGACFINQNLVNYCVIIQIPSFAGGNSRTADSTAMQLADCHYQVLGSAMVAHGPVTHG